MFTQEPTESNDTRQCVPSAWNASARSSSSNRPNRTSDIGVPETLSSCHDPVPDSETCQVPKWIRVTPNALPGSIPCRWPSKMPSATMSSFPPSRLARTKYGATGQFA
jgi:hypothetical protein